MKHLLISLLGRVARERSSQAGFATYNEEIVRLMRRCAATRNWDEIGALADEMEHTQPKFTDALHQRATAAAVTSSAGR